MKRSEMLQKLATIHASMLARSWALTRTESNSDTEVREYTGDATLTADGSGIWGAAAGVQVQIECVTIVCTLDDCDGEEDENYCSWHVGVQHTFDESAIVNTHGLRGGLYTDDGIEAGVSALLGVGVCFTESGMQDEYYLSME